MRLLCRRRRHRAGRLHQVRAAAGAVYLRRRAEAVSLQIPQADPVFRVDRACHPQAAIPVAIPVAIQANRAVRARRASHHCHLQAVSPR